MQISMRHFLQKKVLLCKANRCEEVPERHRWLGWEQCNVAAVSQLENGIQTFLVTLISGGCLYWSDVGLLQSR